MRKVFVSFNRESLPLVLVLANDMKGLGHTVWFDQELSGGQSWWDQILEQIRNCDVFIFALAPGSLESVACTREYEYAFSLGKPIIPVTVTEGVSINLLPDALSQIQSVDYRNADDKTATLSLGKALNSVTLSGSLPDPLPTPPEVPLSYLGDLAARAAAPNLSYEEQTALVLDIKVGLNNPDTDEDSRTLLQRLKQRSDLLAKTEDEIDELLGNGKLSAAAANTIDGKQGWGFAHFLGLGGVLVAAVFAVYSLWPRPIVFPEIISFQASAESIESGEVITLAWETSNAETVVLQPGVGVFQASDEVIVSPTESMVYNLIAIDSEARRVETSISVAVSQSDVEPPEPPPTLTTTGFAGFLGDGLHGNLTASGEPYDMNANSAAKHQALEDALGNLSYGTDVRVTNLVSGASVIVKIIDRGGSNNQDRIIDLSRVAFSSIASTAAGTVRVRVEVVEE